jgi:glycosyltransferase involved in cell wall biosynthesis
MTVHLVYAKGVGKRAPFSITSELSQRLAATYPVVVHDWLDRGRIEPRRGDVLVGHCAPARNTVFRRSFFDTRWSRRLLLQPFSHGLPGYVAFLQPFVMEADRFLAICGPYWWKTLDSSPFRHWKHRMSRLDMAIDASHFPPAKSGFALPGNRSFLYVGHDDPRKGTDYLRALAAANPEIRFGWIGTPAGTLGAIRCYGRIEMASAEAREIVSQYDFILACGRSDANPTTVLEGLSLGLAPVCTPQSGYDDDPWLVSIPLDDVGRASRILHDLNVVEESFLVARVESGRAELRTRFSWDTFAERIFEAIKDGPVEDPSGDDWRREAESLGLELRRIARQQPRFAIRKSLSRRILRAVSNPRRILSRVRSWIAPKPDGRAGHAPTPNDDRSG